LPPLPTHTSNNTITECKPCSTSPQDSSDIDIDSDYSDYSSGWQLQRAATELTTMAKERAARKIHLLLNEIPIPK
jgi:hypothetical protein